jgi:hypothetical protein
MVNEVTANILPGGVSSSSGNVARVNISSLPPTSKAAPPPTHDLDWDVISSEV